MLRKKTYTEVFCVMNHILNVTYDSLTMFVICFTITPPLLNLNFKHTIKILHLHKKSKIVLPVHFLPSNKAHA